MSCLLALAACNQPATQTEAPASAAETSTAPETQAAPPDSATMMAAWTAYATPGDMHAMLAKFEGEWDGDITMWMDPSAPPTKNTGTAVSKMILGGLYQESTHVGTFNGMQFEGRSIMAFDNVKKKFLNTWIDMMGSGIMMMEGTWDEANKTIHFTGKQVDPVSGQDMDVRETLKFVDDNTQFMEMFMKYPGGEEFKTMEIKSTRKQKAS